jgi:hypothetical protein
MSRIPVILVISAQLLVASELPSPTTLSATSKNPLPVPGFGFYGNAQCDPDGNMFFHSGGDYNALTFIKISPKGTYEVYKYDKPEGDGLFFIAFKVSSEGKLWVLAGRGQDELYALESGSELSSLTATKLDLPTKIGPLSIRNVALLANQRLRIVARVEKKDAKETTVYHYVFDFEASGKLVNQRRTKGDAKDADFELRSAASASGSDGSLYLLEPDKVRVLSGAGELHGTVRLNAPAKGFTPFNIYAARGQLLVAFVKKRAEKAGPMQVEYLLLDPSSGEVLGRYVPGPETGNNLFCFSPDGLIFGRVEAGHLTLVTADTK